MPQAALIGGPSIEVPHRLSYGPPELGIADGWSNRDRHRLCDLIPHCEDVGEITVIAVRPDVIAGLGFNELCGDADPIASLAHAAFEHVAHTELTLDVLHI